MEIKNEEKIKNDLLKKMNNATSIEELLDLKWQFTKIFYTRYYTVKALTFYKNVERIAYVNALRNISNIVNDLIKNKSIEEIIGDIEQQTPSRRYQIQMFLEDLHDINTKDFIKI